MKIAGRTIESTEPCFIVAEIGLNHNGNMELAHKLIDKAKECGVDAIKLQKRDPEACLTKAGLEAPYTGRNSFGATYGEHRRALELNADQWAELRDHAKAADLYFFGSAFDVPSLLFLAGLGLPAIKIPSCEVTHARLLHAAAVGLRIPLILSTGMATDDELTRAVDTLHPARAAGRLALMHCVSGYPVENRDANLERMGWLGRYGCPVGYSGHERGVAVTVAAVARGACIVERHFTLDRAAPGPDHAASLEVPGLRLLVRDIRKIEAAMGPRQEQPLPCELSSKRKLRKATVAAADLPAGSILGPLDVAFKSPEVEGAVPADNNSYIGKRLVRAVAEDTPILWSDLEG